jgi:hypothetical protein
LVFFNIIIIMFSINSYVICVDTSACEALTLYKRYQVLNDPKHQKEIGVQVLNNYQHSTYYNYLRFITIEEFRNQKIEQLGI